MNPWNRAAIQAVFVSLLMVLGIVLVRGFFHSWEELRQPDFWIEKAVIFVIMWVVLAFFYWRIFRTQA